MDLTSTTYNLYPDIAEYSNGMLDLDGHHLMYWEISGNPEGVPVVFLHGGPGAGASPSHRRFFDPEYYKIIIFDQRGSGRSKPFAEIAGNTTQHLVSDIETLRQYLEIDRWLIFGGSWGSSLGLAYGIAYSDRVLGFILRGTFLCTSNELDWFLRGIKTVFPQEWQEFCSFLPEDEQGELLNSYHKRLINPDNLIHGPAAFAWSQFEGSCSTLLPNVRSRAFINSGRTFLALARIESHYFLNNFFLPDNYFYKYLYKIIDIPATIIQGRYDMICPILTAYEYSNRWPNANLVVIPDAGHSAMEPSLKSALVAATENFKSG
jgi:proline iminopeptidase